MNRRQYLEQLKKNSSWRPWGVFPAQYPRELLWALDILPVEIWDPPAKGGRAEAHLQPYICSVVRLGLDLVLSGRADMVEGFLFPHTCDSIQNLASVVNDYLETGKPCRFLYHPKEPYAAAAREYYIARLKQLAADLAAPGREMDPAGLARRIDQGAAITDRLAKLYDRRAAGRLAMTNAHFYHVVRLGEYLTPEDYTVRLDEALTLAGAEADSGRPGVILSGVLPSPPGILDLLDDLGVAVAADDLINTSRRLLPGRVAAADGDPWQALADIHFSLPPCSTKASPIADRLAWLTGLAEKSGAGGVIFHEIKFCETELFDLPHLRAGLEAAGLPSLVLDVEAGGPFTGREATRVEAFIEMISGVGRG